MHYRDFGKQQIVLYSSTTSLNSLKGHPFWKNSCIDLCEAIKVVYKIVRKNGGRIKWQHEKMDFFY